MVAWLPLRRLVGQRLALVGCQHVGGVEQRLSHPLRGLVHLRHPLAAQLLDRGAVDLRRAGRLPGGPPPLRFGRLELDRGGREVRLDGSEVALTSYQFDLLAALAEHAGRVLSRERLMDLVKGAELDAFDRSIDVHISRIRAAIEDDPKHPRRIITVRGAGYVFARSQDEAT